MNSHNHKAMHKGLMKLLDEATFPLLAKEVAAFVQVYNWAKDLENKLDKLVDKPKPAKKVSKK